MLTSQVKKKFKNPHKFKILETSSIADPKDLFYLKHNVIETGFSNCEDIKQKITSVRHHKETMGKLLCRNR